MTLCTIRSFLTALCNHISYSTFLSFLKHQRSCPSLRTPRSLHVFFCWVNLAVSLSTFPQLLRLIICCRFPLGLLFFFIVVWLYCVLLNLRFSQWPVLIPTNAVRLSFLWTPRPKQTSFFQLIFCCQGVGPGHSPYASSLIFPKEKQIPRFFLTCFYSGLLSLRFSNLFPTPLRAFFWFLFFLLAAGP